MTTANAPLAADRAFLWNLERHSPGLHVGGLARIEGRIEPRELLQQVNRLGELPRFRLRVDTPPIGGPRWRPVRFEPESHVQIAGPENPASALDTALSQPLDPRRPLWEVHLLPGFHADGDALLIKTHLATADGLGASDLFEVLFNSSPKIADVPPERSAVNGKRNGNGNMFPPGLGAGKRMSEWIENWTLTGQDLLDTAMEFSSEEVRTAFLALNEVMPDAALPPLPLPFNGPVRGRRRLIRCELSYADVRRIRARFGGALSDVVLATVAGGLDRYLSRRGVPTAGRSLKIALATDVADRGGNRRSLLPVEVPLAVGASHRLRAVLQLTRLLRAAHVADALSRLAGVQRAAGPLAAATTAVAASIRPPFHLTVANATGPQIPQFLAGRPVIGYTPSWPVGFGQGLSCAFFAYNQLLHVGLTVDERACPDGNVLPDLLAESLGELREAAGSPARQPVRDAPPAPSAHADQTLET